MSTPEVLSSAKDEAMTAATTTETKSKANYNPPAMTLNDRCDRCGAEALTRIVMPLPTVAMYKTLTPHSVKIHDRVTYDVLLCGHHTTKHEMALIASGGTFHHKNRDFLTPDRLKGSDH